MKVVVPLFEGRVAPVLDWSHRLLVLEVAACAIVSRRELTLPIAGSGRLEAIADTGARVLLCGGVSRELQTDLEAAGVKVLPWLAGEVDAVVAEFLAGRLPSDAWSMPGCCQRRRGCGGRHQGEADKGRQGRRRCRSSQDASCERQEGSDCLREKAERDEH